MRYALISETYPPEINGVALTVQSLEQGLRQRGHEVQLIRPKQRDEAAALAESVTPAAHLLTVPSLPVPKYPQLRFGLPSTGRLLKLWKFERPDAVYVATEGPLGWSALKAAKILGIPAVTGFHTRFDEYMRDYGVGFLRPAAVSWMRRFHNRAARTLVPTRELQRELQELGFEGVDCLPRAVDCNRFTPQRRDASLRTQWGLGRHDLAVVYLGRIAAEKNLQLAINAFRALQMQRPDARYIWIGDGPKRAEIEAENPDFIFTGTLRGTELATALASCDLFVFPSRSETFGNVTLEAMASGVPTIAFDYGSAHEFLRHRIHGEVLPVDDENGFTDAVVRLGLDDTRRPAMGLAARQAMEKLRPEQVAADLDSMLCGLAVRGDHDAKIALA
ncbi:glycosyltransferase family 1 protein [Luteimonas sp. FXH3W]|uniref:Glycosyltransferase family 1 protein n=1 Tax=Aquilutibacter rugosus TaxID=3115820 RepID=A0ABU7V163_9GAMM